MNDSPCLISTPSTEQVWAWLEHLTDPEIPVLTLKELGVLREVEVEVGGGVRVTITPTYSGCPAVAQIKDDIRQLLAQHGLSAEIITQLSPAWSTDGLSAETHRKLREYGIAPAHWGRPSDSVGCGCGCGHGYGTSDAQTADGPGAVPALRIGQHHGNIVLWFHRLQGNVQVPELPRTV